MPQPRDRSANSTPATERRIARLEAAVRTQRRVSLALLVLLTCTIAAGAFQGGASPLPDVLQARAFEVVDENETVVARLAPGPGGGALKLLTSDGKPSVEAYARHMKGGYFVVYNGDTGEPAVQIQGVGSDGGLLALLPGNPRQNTLYFSPDKLMAKYIAAEALDVFDYSTTRASRTEPASKEGPSPSFPPSISLRATDGRGIVSVNSKSGAVHARLQSNGEESGEVWLRARDGKEKTLLP